MRDGQVALDGESAAKGEYEVGDRVRVATNGPVKEYTLSGVFTTEDGAVNAGGSLVLFDTAVAQKQYLRQGYFEDATVVAAPGADDAEILAAVEPLLPDSAEAQTGTALADEQAEQIEQGMGNLKQVLLGFAGIALFVGVFLISNTFTMLVAQRTKEVALMRAVGASRRQITRSVLAEAAVVGLVASAVGFALGVGLAVGLRSGMAAFDMKMPDGPLVLSATPVVAAFAVGVLITVFAAWLPGRRAAKIPPVAAMNSLARGGHHQVAGAAQLRRRGGHRPRRGGDRGGRLVRRRRGPDVHRRGRVPRPGRRDHPDPAAVPARDRARPSAARRPLRRAPASWPARTRSATRAAPAPPPPRWRSG
ncbi:hypothetical protein STENM223S_11559 [Streptomyces tendae]